MNEALYTFKILVEVPKTFYVSKFYVLGTSLVVQWLRLCGPNAGGMGLMPGQTLVRELKSCIPHGQKKNNNLCFILLRILE